MHKNESEKCLIEREIAVFLMVATYSVVGSTRLAKDIWIRFLLEFCRTVCFTVSSGQKGTRIPRLPFNQSESPGFYLGLVTLITITVTPSCTLQARTVELGSEDPINPRSPLEMKFFLHRIKKDKRIDNTSKQPGMPQWRRQYPVKPLNNRYRPRPLINVS